MRGERGLSLSVVVAASMAMVVLLLGLVVDGGRQLTAQQRAEGIALQAARAGVDAAAPGAVVGSDSPSRAVTAARGVLADEGVNGQVNLIAGGLRVDTTVEAQTVFLSVIGIRQLSGHGSAEAELVPVAP